jgi:high affinity sulfate transporter 1
MRVTVTCRVGDRSTRTMPDVTTIRYLLGSIRRGIEGPEGPPLAWTLRPYRPDQLSGDVIGGLTVAALIVPVAIGYAGVAGLPPEMGLYASLAPLVAYAVFGSGRRLIVGPDASTAALIGVTIAPLAAASDDRVRLASALAILVATIFVVMRLGRMGFLSNLLSRPILVGYMAGVGITVAASQVEKMAGGPAITVGVGLLSRIDWLSADVPAVAEAVGIALRGSGANGLSLAIGLGVVAVLLLTRRFLPRVPMALLVMVVGVVVSAVIGLQSLGVQILGPVPAGLPPVGIPVATPAELLALLPGALGLAIMSYANATVTGRSFAAMHGERIDANRELVALAAADAANGLTSGYPVSASPSRTAVGETAGASSQLAGLVAAAAVAVVLVLLTVPLSYLPVPVLGAVVLVSVLPLISVGSMRAMWRLRPSEGAIALIALTGVVLYGTLVGVAIAVLLAALNIVRRAAWPEIVEEGRLSVGSWHDLTRTIGARRVQGVVTLRFAGPLFFANATALDTLVREIVAARPDTVAIVLDLGATADVDLTAGDTIRDMSEELARGRRRLAVARPIGHVRDQLRAYGLGELMAPTAGTRGSVDQAIIGLGLDPTLLVPEDEEEAEGSATLVARPLPGVVPLGQEPLVLRVLVVGIAIVAIAAVIGFGLTNWLSGSPASSSTVPNLIGLPLERATEGAQDAGFKLGEPVYVRRNDQPEGTVVDQDPPAGTVADEGAVIEPFVSTGRQLVQVPDVTGKAQPEAIATLAQAGLTVRRAGTSSDAVVPDGSVISTTPVAGTAVATGTSVGIIVSTGPAASP